MAERGDAQNTADHFVLLAIDQVHGEHQKHPGEGLGLGFELRLRGLHSHVLLDNHILNREHIAAEVQEGLN